VIITGKSDVGFFEATATFTEDRFGAVDQNVADGGVTEQLFERSESEGFIHHLADEQIPIGSAEQMAGLSAQFFRSEPDFGPQLGFGATSDS